MMIFKAITVEEEERSTKSKAQLIQSFSSVFVNLEQGNLELNHTTKTEKELKLLPQKAE